MVKTAIRFYLKRYGHDFRVMREDLGLTQFEVAKKLLCSQAIISHIEMGYYLPSPAFEQELLDLYNAKGGLNDED